MPTRTLMWFRRDLRVHDNPAFAAAGAGGEVVPLLVLDPQRLGSAHRPRSAAYLAAATGLSEALDGKLVVRSGDPRRILPEVCAATGAGSVHVSAEVTPAGMRRDAAVREALVAQGVEWVETGCPYAVGPGLVRTGSGSGFQVFTPFARAWREHGWRSPAELPAGTRVAAGIESEGLPGIPDGVLPAVTAVTEVQARERWAGYREELVDGYAGRRDRADLDATSRLSTALKLGLLHPRTLLHDLAGESGRHTETFVTELAWREFYADVLWRHPRSAWHDLRDNLADLRHDDPTDDPVAAARLEAWQQGRTGYPMIDAGMRQLLAEGWMHNRLRMVVASFLCKDLHIRWQHGARYFMDHLTDGDLASNSHGWQWVAGTGTDAAPYFRIFNPITQGERADPNGDYVRRYVTELEHIEGAAVHEPWKVHGGLAHGYPERVVDHAQERRETLARYEAARST